MMVKASSSIYLFVSLLIIACHNTTNEKSVVSSKSTVIADMDNCDNIIVRLHTKKLDSITTVHYIPKNFEECLAQLDTLINDSLKLWVKCLPDGYFGNIVHQSFGMYLRNQWKLLEDSELSLNLHQLGIIHPDDMSAIILDSYQRKIKDENIRLNEQIKKYQDYWKETGYPVDSFLNTLASDKENP